MRRGALARVLGFAAAALVAALPASAQSPAPFYQGKHIVMLIASGAGGGYDTYARALARYMPKYIPGNPTIVPKNVPGANNPSAWPSSDAWPPAWRTRFTIRFPPSPCTAS